MGNKISPGDGPTTRPANYQCWKCRLDHRTHYHLPPTPIAVDAEVLPTPTSEDIDNMEYFSRKMRERRREKMAEDEPTLPLTRKSKRISQKNKLQF